MNLSERAVREARERAGGLAERAPAVVPSLIDAARRHETLLLAGGLAFFGLISLPPAVAVGFGVLRLVASPEAASHLANNLQQVSPETLQLGELLEATQDRGGRYAGLGLVILLWPATTLASGWSRALDAVNEYEALPVARGLAGRLRGLGVGFALLVGVLALFAAVTAGSALVGQVALLVPLVGAGVAGVFGFCLALYRWLPSQRRSWAALWPGAAWATAGTAVATTGFALALAGAGSLAQNYPAGLSTALVLGLWLYAANLSLLLGDEYNAWRARA